MAKRNRSSAAEPPWEELKAQALRELGLEEKVRRGGWSALTAAEAGRLGGWMTRLAAERRHQTPPAAPAP